jgi:segregation and condensation protein B
MTNSATDDARLTNPRTILEAMLFVGHPENEPLTAEQVAGCLRGVQSGDVPGLVAELNDEYERLGCPYRVVAEGVGYRLTLAEQWHKLRDRFYGKVREARLSQAIIDALSIVAYHQPISQERVDELRGKPSGAILRQLVRRRLLRMEMPQQKSDPRLFYTTERFLTLFGLESLDQLPQSEDVETKH